MEKLVAYVRPEFLHDVEASIETDLLAPLVESGSERSVCSWIVQVGDARCDSIPHQL